MIQTRTDNLQDAGRQDGAFKRAGRYLGRRDLRVFAFVLLAFASAWISVEVTDAVTDGPSGHVDRVMLLALRQAGDPDDPIGPPWFEGMVRDFTALGAAGPLTFLCVAVIGYLALSNRRRAALLAAVSIGGGVVLSHVLKAMFERPRPSLVPHAVVVTSWSFPSGHSMMSAVAYLTLAALLCRLDRDLLGRAYIMVCAILLTILVGLSRVYLGVHWPTDVAAGWTFGAAWAVLCWLVARRLQREGMVEQ